MFVLEEFFRKLPSNIRLDRWGGGGISGAFSTTGKLFIKFPYYRRYGSNLSMAFYKRMVIIGGEDYVSTVQTLQL